MKQWIKDRFEYLNRIKGNIIRWLAFYAVLVYSMRHVAHFFNSMDTGGWGWGWVAAFAIDATIAAAAHGSDKRQRGKIVTGTVIVFTLLSIFANLDYTLTTALGSVVIYDLIWTLDYWQLGKALAVASPPLLVFGLAEILKEADEQQPTTPEPTTALATTTNHRQPATDNPQPKVKVRRRDNRIAATKAAAALPDNLPTMQRLHPTTATATPQPQSSTYGQVDDFSDNRHHNYNPPPATEVEELQLVEVVESEVPQDAIDAVRWLQQGFSIAKIAKQQGISSEGVRKRLRVAYLADPEGVEERIPGWVADNEKFLSEKR